MSVLSNRRNWGWGSARRLVAGVLRTVVRVGARVVISFGGFVLLGFRERGWGRFKGARLGFGKSI